MCDTFVATQSATTNQVTLFAKNSDRPPNEAQALVQIPSQKFNPGEYVECTYIQIPQVESTNAVLLSQPFWMWGAEMGVNEHGLAIGNEAVFSKVPANKEPALLGMDLLRLALERAVNPPEAIEVITTLLEKYGQGGNCVYDGKLYYHNSFLMADANEAWVLETVDREWAAKRVDTTYSISNVLTLEEQWDKASEGLVNHAVENKIASRGGPLNISQDYPDFLITTFSNARNRCSLTKKAMDAQHGDIDVKSMMSILRSHNGQAYPHDSLSAVDVCMHAGFGPIRISQSTASMVVYLGSEGPTVFATGTSAPCTGVFKPFWVDSSLPDMGPLPKGHYDESTLFWRHERLHRLVLRNAPNRLAEYAEERDALEAEFIKGALEMASASKEERADYSEKCYRDALKAEQKWFEKVQQIPEKKSLPNLINNFAWNKFNDDVGLKL